MNKFFDYLYTDLSTSTIRQLLQYIRKYAANFGGDIPLIGNMGPLSFCATQLDDGNTRVHWVKVGTKRITIDALI